MREHAVHNALTCCPQCSAEMQHTEQLSTLQEKNIIPEAESQEIMSGDNICSLERHCLCRWQLPLMEKIYWYSIKLHTHLGHNSSHVLHKNIVKFQMSPGNGRLWTSGKVWINFFLLNQMQWRNYTKFSCSFHCGQVILMTAISQALILSSLFREHN